MQIEIELKEVHGALYQHLRLFSTDQTRTKDLARSGRPIEVSFEEMTDKIHGIVLEHCHIKHREIAELVGTSYE